MLLDMVSLFGPSSDNSRDKWRSFMDEKHKILQHANIEISKIMEENRRLRGLLSHDVGAVFAYPRSTK